MLKQLLIKNYALIQHLEIEPASSLNIITGETGAGKSIMLGALGLLKGERADTKSLFDAQAKCVVEGTFDIGMHELEALFEEFELDHEDICLIRREISPSGKSRAFINDTPVNLEALRKISVRLMDIHSQHDTLLLGSQDYQLELVDSYLQNQVLLVAYQEKYQAFRQAEKHYKQLRQEQATMQKEFDFNQHLLKELEEANLNEINQGELEKELERHENAEAIKSGLNGVIEYVNRAEYSAESLLKSAVQALTPISGYAAQYEDMRQRLDSCLIELLDIVYEAEKEESELEHDFEREQFIRDQLDKLYSLQKKHQVETTEALLAIQSELQERVDRVVNSDADLEAAQAAMQAAQAEMLAAAQVLSENRNQGLPFIAEAVNALLSDLGMPNGKASFDHHIIDPTPNGTDEVQLLFSANKGVAPQPLKSVASGGEFSRLMLAVKYILASKTSMPTIIFDEIDTGISGEVAIKVGHMMEEMAQHHQVMAISHLPQMAALGKQHYYVFKDHSADRTISRIRLLSEEDRVQEIAQMIGGASPSESAYKSARELMGLDGKSMRMQ